MYKNWKRIREGKWIFEEDSWARVNFWNSKRERERKERRIFGQKIVLEESSLSLSLSFDKWNERKKECTRVGKEFERERVNFWNSKRERGRGDFWAENRIGSHLSLFFDEWNEREGKCTRVAREFERERESEIRKERGGDFWTENRIGRARWRETFDLSGRVHDRIVGTRILLQQPLRC